jgi:hypothetical protein
MAGKDNRAYIIWSWIANVLFTKIKNPPTGADSYLAISGI